MQGPVGECVACRTQSHQKPATVWSHGHSIGLYSSTMAPSSILRHVDESATPSSGIDGARTSSVYTSVVDG
jgi:hypothetical protein